MEKSKLIFLPAEDKDAGVHIEAFVNTNNNLVIRICESGLPASLLIELNKETADAFSKRIKSLLKFVE